MKAIFKVSNETRKEQLLAGNEVPTQVSIDIDFSALSESERQLILRHSTLKGDEIYPGYDGAYNLPTIDVEANKVRSSNMSTQRHYEATLNAYNEETLMDELRRISTLIDVTLPQKLQEERKKARADYKEKWDGMKSLLSFSERWNSFEKVAQKLDISDDYMSALKERFDEEKEQKERRDREEENRRKKERAKKKAEAELQRRKRAEWIEAHGSDRLKKMLAGDYELTMTYEEERTAHEYAGFEVDTAGERFDWTERANPSEEALIEAERHDGEVVWLTNDKELHEGNYFDFEETEAIRVKPDWSRFSLIMSL